MKYLWSISLFISFFCLRVACQDLPEENKASREGGRNEEVVGFCIAAPRPQGLDDFLAFMENGLAANGINTLILRVDYNYAYESHPELRARGALSKDEVKRIVETARDNNIRLIPQINLLGHQSWAGSVGMLLDAYPQFDETPWVEMPEDYVWPNEDGLYCKSYCPLHPGVHKVIFDVVDELMEAFEADAFHAGMDEVFYIGEDSCPRCGGRNKAELFAGEVKTIHDHLAEKGIELWIWGDRLLDGKVTGLGKWEASENGTQGAVDLIPKDVVICDWHYEGAPPTPAYFALKGFRVLYCSFSRKAVTRAQLEMTDILRNNSNDTMRDRYLGFIQTVWSPAGRFLDDYYGSMPARKRHTGFQDDDYGDPGGGDGAPASFRELIRYLNNKD